MTTPEKPTAAFILSLIAGVFILLGGGMTAMVGSYMWSYGFGMMRGYWNFGSMMGLGMMGGWLGFMGIIGIVFGAIIIISSFMLNVKPEEHAIWGSLIVVFSILSIFGSAMGGFGIGLVMGLVGGILAITWTGRTSDLSRIT